MNASQDVVIFVSIATVVIWLILGIVGSSMALKGQIIVFVSKADVVLTCTSFILSALCGLAFIFRDSHDMQEFTDLKWILLVTSAVLLITTIRPSFRANGTAGRTILSLSAKYVLAMAVLFCAILAIGGISNAFKSAAKKRYKETAEYAVVGAAGAAGYYFLSKFINRLIVNQRQK
jgi:hypothetical protein